MIWGNIKSNRIRAFSKYLPISVTSKILGDTMIREYIHSNKIRGFSTYRAISVNGKILGDTMILGNIKSNRIRGVLKISSHIRDFQNIGRYNDTRIYPFKQNTRCLKISPHICDFQNIGRYNDTRKYKIKQNSERCQNIVQYPWLPKYWAIQWYKDISIQTEIGAFSKYRPISMNGKILGDKMKRGNIKLYRIRGVLKISAHMRDFQNIGRYNDMRTYPCK